MEIQQKELLTKLAEAVGCQTFSFKESAAIFIAPPGTSLTPAMTPVKREKNQIPANFSEIPNYFESLDDVNKIEQGLSQAQHNQFRDELIKIVIEQGKESGQTDYGRFYVSASARQRALALLKVFRITVEE